MMTMGSSSPTSSSSSVLYAPLPENSSSSLGYPVDAQPYFVYLSPPPLRHRHRRLCLPCRSLCSFLSLSSLLSFLALSAFFLWPRPLSIDVNSLTLRGIHFNVNPGDSFIPQVFLNITLVVHAKVQNFNFFHVTYDSVTVQILYRGDEVGEVQSSGGHLQARGSSYVDATLELSGYEIANNIVSLLEDIASGALPLKTVTRFDGRLNIWWFELPIDSEVSCYVVVDPQNQVLLSQYCDA